MTIRTVLLSLSASAALAGCGASSGAAGSTTASATTESSAAPDISLSARSPEATSPSSLVVATDAPDTRLDDRVEVPGTGVSMRAPRGSVRTPIGAGFVDPRGRFEIVVSISSTPPESVDPLARLAEDSQEIHGDAITISGHPARLVVDTVEDDGVQLERVWTIVRDGARALSLLAVYPSNASDRLREAVRASLLSAAWNARATIDPERAAGFGMSPPPGLAAVPQVMEALTYVQPGVSLSPESGRPAMMVLQLPVDLPPAERARSCELLLLHTGPISADGVVSRAEITSGTTQGCEVFGTEEIPDPAADGPTSLATYAAIVFVDDGTFMVAGFVDAAEGDAWSPRFASAARTVGRAAR